MDALEDLHEPQEVKLEAPDYYDYEYYNDDSGCDFKMEPMQSTLDSSSESLPSQSTTEAQKATPKTGNCSEMKQLLNGRYPVIKLERIDDGQGKRDRGYLTKSEEEDDSEEDEDSNSKPPQKSKVETFWHHQNLRIFPGNYTCSFCPKTWGYAGELAVHESLQHSTSAPRPGNLVKSIKKRYFCPRCPFNCLRRSLYVSHHLTTHLGLNQPVPESTSKNSKDHPTDSSDTFPCEICQWPLSKSRQYSKRDHFRTHHNLKDIPPSSVERCPQCPAYFRRGIQLIRHKQKIHHTTITNPLTNHKRHLCQNCHKSFYTLPDLWRHRRHQCNFRHLFSWTATCPLEGCYQKFEFTADLDYHLTNSHSSDKLNGALVSCPECGRQCMGHFGLLTHMSTHQSTEGNEKCTLQCQYCGERLKSRMYFNRHMKRHFTQDNPEGQNSSGFICDQCGKQFPVKSLLITHLEFHKDPKNWGWECPECGKKCVTKQQLQVHTRTHTGEKPFVCDLCGEAFAYRHFLRNHVNTNHLEDGVEDKVRQYKRNRLGDNGGHLGRRKKYFGTRPEFKCEQCQKQFSTKQALQVHGRVHSGEMPFGCEICDMKFRYRQLLREHVNSKHKEEGIVDKPRNYRKKDVEVESKKEKVGKGKNGFECEKCGNVYSTKQAMQIHLRTHTGEKPFECQVCKEKFRYRHVLREHVNKRHANEGVKDLPRQYIKRGENLFGNL